MINNEVKKVIRRIYEFDLKITDLVDGTELGSTDRGSDFVNNFKKNDIDNGIIVMPLGYKNGLVYKSTNGGELYNHPEWTPDIVNFSLNIFGLKKKAFYRVTVIGRNTHKYSRLIDITDDRVLHISNDQDELILEHDFSENFENTEVSGVFRANSTEINLFFRLGKIYINNIIIDEIEILQEEVAEPEIHKDVEITDDKLGLVAIGVFSPVVEHEKGRYQELTKITGRGINLYFDTTSKKYIIERDNVEDTLNENFNSLCFILDINTNKIPNPNIFDRFQILEVSTDISPNTLKQGYTTFQFIKDNEPIRYEYNDARIIIAVRRLF